MSDVPPLLPLDFAWPPLLRSARSDRPQRSALGEQQVRNDVVSWMKQRAAATEMHRRNNHGGREHGTD